ncbi:molybdopterin converting factor subunit 1 [Caldimonas thermodepolymerans]|jgi:molybdopterin converting factor, subunit 1, non-archaeal|uniref:Molybdopterin synthase sulfur carrier subunit n=1 Tax=Caldimonas thermodepolymerans TaxID=215580 RepID=A0A2S5T1W9_9BURK|nr:molybdopterin converting factor subunit 1 [Caldimonas thermodepolymerans]PPE68942.1 molybdopterin converting factor subunit 1 [Caldimonas thermodepolymerans]QPC30085.1 molybdopterin converting factor subunit 1 [Caldimonas thermodepolymerans]RDI00459.1 molybdopterin synthase subunit MoaD [Caldimonas thermodepolymerans]TCP07262.1 molybdopterin synthase subunit MoaD [Caldimonas thermodepolymerans]UZG42837.1 molybdopterin converting factor subunit 1 [Caldimonas thermodepolymerans]
MKVSVKYFASIREALGPGETVELAEGATVGALRELLIARSPAHGEALARGKALRMALNQALCDEAAVVTADAEVAFFPPVTGG